MQLRWDVVLADNLYRVKSGIHNRLIPRNLEKRINSYPYLCPDTYLYKSQLRITSQNNLEEFLQNAPTISECKSLYIIGELVVDLIKKLPQLETFKTENLVIMESDTQQSTKELEQLLIISKNIFSNNLMGSHKSITPIPLGLERQAYRSAGKISNFQVPGKTDPTKRKIDFLIAWNDGTNTKRIDYRREFMSSGKGLVLNTRVHSKTIHKLMRKSLFIPSPAGNGLDCHRTWEALYLGSVPVVLKKEFCGDETWPVHVVDSWEELISLSRNELENLYTAKALTRSQALAYSDSLLKRVFND
ncbi:unannotated protein [freshwater metagenome]|uniref:Unannotated protein n=1 Tax=freshwater metagenome TaxID=449393 RepID=A0A6J6F5K0_9ZZZZ|nr:hypothetical protein [Actinomycetota bacterium]